MLPINELINRDFAPTNLCAKVLIRAICCYRGHTQTKTFLLSLSRRILLAHPIINSLLPLIQSFIAWTLLTLVTSYMCTQFYFLIYTL